MPSAESKYKRRQVSDEPARSGFFVFSQRTAWASGSLPHELSSDYRNHIFVDRTDALPAALTSCASAVESIIKASPSYKSGKQGLGALLEAARDRVEFIRNAPELELARFREVRNHIIHEGFSAKDHAESAALMIQVGFPLISACLNDLHSFDMADGLLQEYAEQLSVAAKVYHRACSSSKDLTYCLKSLGHLIRWSLQGSFSAYWADEALNYAEQSGQKFDIVHPERGRIERQFGAPWVFDCPICDEVESAVAELSRKPAGLNSPPPRIALAMERSLNSRTRRTR